MTIVQIHLVWSKKAFSVKEAVKAFSDYTQRQNANHYKISMEKRNNLSIQFFSSIVLPIPTNYPWQAFFLPFLSQCHKIFKLQPQLYTFIYNFHRELLCFYSWFSFLFIPTFIFFFYFSFVSRSLRLICFKTQELFPFFSFAILIPFFSNSQTILVVFFLFSPPSFFLLLTSPTNSNHNSISNPPKLANVTTHTHNRREDLSIPSHKIQRKIWVWIWNHLKCEDGHLS